MTQQAFSNYRVLIVPGLHGSGPGHWQTRWQERHPDFERVHQARWNMPDLAVWSHRLDLALRTSTRPTLIVAHSFGCLTAIHRASLGTPNLYGALLVAPADPVKFGVEEALREVALPCPSIVVGSTDDPWMEGTRAKIWAERWGSAFVNAGALGHINAESDLGEWEFGLSLLNDLAIQAGIEFAVDRAVDGRGRLR